MSYTIKALALSGSLRQASVNTALLRVARDVAPAGMSVEIYGDLAHIPPYDDDLRMAGYPAAVETLRTKVRDADALIFATPEYNRSFYGVLKNAIDWASRPSGQLFGIKAASVMGAGPGVIGSALANYHLRQVLSIVGVHVLSGYEVLAGVSAARFDGLGALTDENTRTFPSTHLAALREFALCLKSSQPRRTYDRSGRL